MEVNVAVPPEKPVITGMANVLTSSVAEGNQWYYNGNPIPGATEATYTAYFIDYDYTVEISNGCGTEISEPYNILVSGLEDPQQNMKLTVYPNPSQSGMIVVSLNPEVDSGKLRIIDISGKIRHEEKFNSSNFMLNLSGFDQGLYYILVETEAGQLNEKFFIRK
jgi:hypothetical protein